MAIDAVEEADDDGSYSITGLEPGSHTLFNDVQGCRILATVKVESDETVTADLKLLRVDRASSASIAAAMRSASLPVSSG